MKSQDYHISMRAKTSAKEAFDNIRDVAGWWTSSFKGSAETKGDGFAVRLGETNVNFKVVELIPHKRIVWQVTDGYLHWLKNKTEWNNTKIVWEISEGRNATKIEMSHLGLVPGIECYKDCEAGWNHYVGESLFKLITTGKGVIDEGSKG